MTFKLSEWIMQGEIDNRTGKYLYKLLYVKKVKEFIKLLEEESFELDGIRKERVVRLKTIKYYAGDKLI